HKERARKTASPSTETLRSLWRSQLNEAEGAMLRPTASSATARDSLSALKAVTWAEEHLFERRSVVREYELWRHALAAGRGGAFSIGDIQRATASRSHLHRDGDKLAHHEALAREWAIVEAARDGIGRHEPLAPLGNADPQLASDQ